MDEILIEEKKYISSKRAAKVTGYAKDYIGQLCREGRVPARLVGRSWYVLESAIHDHRFGDQRVEQDTQEIKQEIKSVSMPTSTWESPRYEASSAEILPSVNRLRDSEASSHSADGQNEVSRHLQDSWKAWFDRVADTDTEPVALATLAVPEEKAEIKEKEKNKEEEEVSIPIHTVYELPPEDLLPQHHLATKPVDEGEEVYIRRERGGRKMMKVIQITGTVFAVLAATVAVIGTGYFDKYILSNSQVGIIAGVASYNR